MIDHSTVDLETDCNPYADKYTNMQVETRYTSFFLVLSQLISKNYFESYFEADLTTKIEKSDLPCFCFKKENDSISRSESVITYQDLAD